MDDEERQRVLSELAKRSPEEEAAAQGRYNAKIALGEAASAGRSIWSWFVRLFLVSFALTCVVVLVQCTNKFFAESERRGEAVRQAQGPIPRQFQGTWNHNRCGSFDSEIRVTGSSVRIGVVNFEAAERVSSEQNRVVLRGRSVAGGYVQSGERVTLRLTGDGSLVFNDGSPAERCD